MAQVPPARTALEDAQDRPADAADLAAKVDWGMTHPEEVAQMRRAARAEYEAKYRSERNYELLMQIYDRVIGKKSSRESERARGFDGQTAGAAETSEREGTTK